MDERCECGKKDGKLPVGEGIGTKMDKVKGLDERTCRQLLPHLRISTLRQQLPFELPVLNELPLPPRRLLLWL